MNRLRTLLVFVLLLGGTTAALAQTTARPDSALQEILKDLKGTPLSLHQAVEQALTNATSVRRAEASYAAAEGTARRERGAFDPQLFFSVNQLDQDQPAASPFAGATVLSTRQTALNGGLRMTLPIGTKLEASVNTNRLNTNSLFATLNPEYDAVGNITVRQPLLSGFAASARKGLSRAEQGVEAEKARYDQEELAVSAEVERTYWDLYAAARNYAVQHLSRERAEEFLRETEVRSRAGLVGPNQVASAKTFLAEQELLLFDRNEDLGRQSDQLAVLIGARPGADLSLFIPVDEPPRDFPVEPVEKLVKQAQENNLELHAAQNDVEAARVLADASKWEALPSVDLIGSLGGNGLAGKAQPVNIPGLPVFVAPEGSLVDALNPVVRRDFPSWSLGVQVTVPIGLRSGLGESDRLQGELLGVQQRREELSRSLEQQVRAAHRELSNGNGRLQAAGRGVEAAQEQVRIGLREFQNGRTTAFELVRLGEDFAIAQQRYSDALVRTAKAAATLKQLTSAENPTPSPK